MGLELKNTLRAYLSSLFAFIASVFGRLHAAFARLAEPETEDTAQKVLDRLQKGPERLTLSTPYGTHDVPASAVPIPEYEDRVDYLEWLQEQSFIRMGTVDGDEDPDYESALHFLGSP